MGRPFAAALVAGTLMTLPAMTIAPATAHAAWWMSDATASAEPFADALLARTGSTLPEEQRADALAALTAAAQADPKNARWPLAIGVLRLAQDKAADAKTQIEKAIALDARNADAHYWHATAIFATINEASMLAKGRLAGQGKAALERAVELAPDYISARIALAEFYRNAPGIAGGSTRKAREQAEALLKIPGGEAQGHRLLGALAMSDKKWADAERHYTAAVEAATDDDARRSVLLSLGYGLLVEKKDAPASLPHLRRVYEMRESDPDVTTLYLYGRALADTGACADAIPLLERAIVKNADAKNSRLTLADCLAKQGRKPEAIAQYEAFIERFPSDDLTKQARRSLRDLQKK